MVCTEVDLRNTGLLVLFGLGRRSLMCFMRRAERVGDAGDHADLSATVGQMGNIKHPGRHRARIASSGTEKANISQIMLELCLLD